MKLFVGLRQSGRLVGSTCLPVFGGDLVMKFFMQLSEFGGKS